MEDYITYTDHIFKNITDPEVLVNWRVRKQPAYRLLDKKQWLDNFFSDGEIVLSCLSKFRNYPDEIRGDKEEGDAMIWFENDRGDTHAFKYESGLNSYILCTTLELTDKVIKDFNAVGAIKIHNPTYFAAEIMQALAGCQHGIEGQCVYDDSRVYRGYSDKMKEILSSDNYLNHPSLRNELMNAACERELFLKLKKYESQNEYRMFWIVDQPVDSNLVIKCPEAIRFCERIDF
jgi:hypothetical protein